MRNVVLLERDRLTSGTTWHSCKNGFSEILGLVIWLFIFLKKLLFLPCWNDAWWCCPVQPALYGSKCLKIIQNSPISLKMNELIDWLPSLRPSDVDVRLLTHTHQLLGGLEDETGVDPGYMVNGGLFIASSKVKPLYDSIEIHDINSATGTGTSGWV